MNSLRTRSSLPLYLGNQDGYTGVNVPLALLQDTLADNAYNLIQIGYSSATDKSWFFGARNNTTASDTLFAISPYGTPMEHFYITVLGKTSSPIFECRTELYLVDQTNSAFKSTIRNDNGFLSFQEAGVTQGGFYSSGTGGYIPLPGDFGFQIGNDTDGTQLILADLNTNKWAVTTEGATYKLYSDNFDPAGVASSWDYLYELTRYGINKFFTNSVQYIPFDMPILSIDNKTFLTSPCIPEADLTQFVTPVVRSGGGNIYDITIKTSGQNPNSRFFTVSVQYALNFTQTSVSGATFPTTGATQNLSIGSQSATINGGSFTGYTFLSSGTGVAYNYTASAISVWDIFQPVGQVTWVITPTNTGNEIDTYVLTIDFNRTETTLTGVTRTARTGNLDGSFITLKGTATTSTTTRTSGSGTLTLSATPINTLLTTARSGDDNLQISNSVDISATRVKNTLQTTGTQFLTVVPLSATNSTTGQVVGTHAPLCYNVATSTLFSPNMNIVYSSAVTATTGIVYVPTIFTSTYTDYEIYVSLASPVSTGTTLSFDLITGASTRLASGWDTLTSYVNGTAMVSLTPPTSL
jgi:hypothetical protein